MTVTKLPQTQRRRRGHGFYPTAAAALPPLYATDNTPAADKMVRAHYFVGGYDWWIVEYNPADGEAYGYANLGDPQNAEWGYISLPELEALRIRGWQVVERDMHWEPKPFAEVMPASVVAVGRG